MSDHFERSSHTSRSSNGRRSGIRNPLFEEVACSDSSSNTHEIPIDDGDIDPSTIRSQAKYNAQRVQSGMYGCLFFVILAGIIILSMGLVSDNFNIFGSNNDNNDDNNNDVDDNVDDTNVEPVIHEVPSLFLVETIPLMNFSLELTPGALNTYEALIDLCNTSTKTLDISVMYWNLLVDENTDDVATNPQKCSELGCNRGQKMYNAFEDAAARGVK